MDVWLSLPFRIRAAAAIRKNKDAFEGGTPSAKASEVSDTPSETPEAGRGYEPPVSSDDYLRWSLLLPFSVGDLRNNPKGCPGEILTLFISPCQGDGGGLA